MRDRRRSRRLARWLGCSCLTDSSCSPQPPSSLFAPYKAVLGVTDKTHGGYRLDGSGLEPRSRQEIFCSLPPFRPARGPTQPVQCVQTLFPRGKVAGAWCSPPTTSSAEVKNEWSYTSTPSVPAWPFFTLRTEYELHPRICIIYA